MEALYNTPLRPPAHGHSIGRDVGGGGGASVASSWSEARDVAPTPSPRAPLPDRYIATRTLQDSSLSRFFLTRKENLTPVLALTDYQDAMTAAGDVDGASSPLLPPPPHASPARRVYGDGDDDDALLLQQEQQHNDGRDDDDDDDDSSDVMATAAAAAVAAVARRRLDDSVAADEAAERTTTTTRTTNRALFASPRTAAATAATMTTTAMAASPLSMSPLAATTTSTAWSPDATLRGAVDGGRALSPPAHAPLPPSSAASSPSSRRPVTTLTTTTATTTTSPSPVPGVRASVSRMTAAVAVAAATVAATGGGGGGSLSRGGSPALVDMLAKLRLDSVSVARVSDGGRNHHHHHHSYDAAAAASVSPSSSPYAAAYSSGGGAVAATRGGSSSSSSSGGTTHDDARAASPYRGCSPMDVDAYTTRLARTLFGHTPQRSVLTLHTPDTVAASPPLFATTTAGASALGGGGSAVVSEQQRYGSSPGVIYEHNRARNFCSSSFRLITQTPERILDAADLVDDFYLNLLDWSSSNVLCVALQSVVYLWDARSCDITRLPPSPTAASADTLVCAVQWAADGQHLAVGLADGGVEVWDVPAQRVVYQCAGQYADCAVASDGGHSNTARGQHHHHHAARVGTLSWCATTGLLTSGSKDTTVHLHDLRERARGGSGSGVVGVLRGHEQEVCGLRWSPHGGVYLASGGNDNQLLLWDRRRLCSTGDRYGSSYSSSYSNSYMRSGGGGGPTPVLYLNQHTAAVKALAWHPRQSSLLASGGGTGDRTLRFWNTLTGDCVRHVNTQSQVCGVLWSHSGSELVSCHGFSHNQLTIWKYPSLRRVADLRGHTSRVLHLCLSPDGEVVVSAASDETIRFWRCFPATADGRAAHVAAAAGATTTAAAGGTGSAADDAIHASRTAASVARVPAAQPMLQPPPPLTYLDTYASRHRYYSGSGRRDGDDDGDDTNGARTGATTTSQRRRRRGASVVCGGVAAAAAAADRVAAAAALARRAASLAPAYTDACDVVDAIALR